MRKTTFPKSQSRKYCLYFILPSSFSFQGVSLSISRVQEFAAGRARRRSFSHYQMQIHEVNFHFARIKIQNSSVAQLTEREGCGKMPLFVDKKRWIDQVVEPRQPWYGGGWNAPLGLVGKRFHPRGWMQKNAYSL